MKHYNILITKETRAEELRVSIIPRDAEELVKLGHTVFVEHNAGLGAGFSDKEYINAGANIRFLNDQSLAAYQYLFKNIDLIVRAKRPERPREILEKQTITKSTIMIGALDPLEKNSPHIDEYHKAGIIAYSIDQLELAPNDPMNLLAAMSKIAGRFALLDAIKKFHGTAKKAVIIGFGIVGHSAFEEALKQKLSTLVILSNTAQAKEIETQGGIALLQDRNKNLSQQQEITKEALADADIIITCARKANQPAPLLIPTNTLKKMQKGAVIVDMALSEGGNVEGSEHDATHILGNDIIVTNVSGYPKAIPHEASELWSIATFHFILLLAKSAKIPLQPC